MAPLSPWARRATDLSESPTPVGLEEGITVAKVALAADPTVPEVDGLLSRRESELLELIAQGLSDRDIAERMTLGVRTVNSHVSSILRKLGVGDRREAVERSSAVAPPPQV